VFNHGLLHQGYYLICFDGLVVGACDKWPASYMGLLFGTTNVQLVTFYGLLQHVSFCILLRCWSGLDKSETFGGFLQHCLGQLLLSIW
jgi:hypothetical protein